MKKVIVFLLMTSVMLLSVFGAFSAFADTGAGTYVLAENEGIGHWFARPGQVGGEWVVTSGENMYASVTFSAEKPFSSIALPFWSGTPAFEGIVYGDIELAIFIAVDGNYGEDYDSNDAVRREVITTQGDTQGFVWSFEQLPVGRFCFRVTLLTEEQAYFVLSEGEPLDDDAEFDLSAIMVSDQGKEGFGMTVFYDDEVRTTPFPTAEPTEPPTEPPVEEATEPPADEPTAEPADEPTAEPADEPTAEPAEPPAGDPTADPGDKPAKKGCGGVAAGGAALLAAAGIVLFLRKKQ